MAHPSHATRYSDSSLYDEVCTLCGKTDAHGMDELDKPCGAADRTPFYARRNDKPEPK
jgi:hypothetical protein